MAEQRKQLGERIAQARKDRRWKQKELASAVHVEPTTVSRWETGRHAPDIDVLEEIARVLERPLSYFVDGPSGHANGASREDELRDEATQRHQEVITRLDAIEDQLRRISVAAGVEA